MSTSTIISTVSGIGCIAGGGAVAAKVVLTKAAWTTATLVASVALSLFGVLLLVYAYRSSRAAPSGITDSPALNDKSVADQTETADNTKPSEPAPAQPNSRTHSRDSSLSLSSGSTDASGSRREEEVVATTAKALSATAPLPLPTISAPQTPTDSSTSEGTPQGAHPAAMPAAAAVQQEETEETVAVPEAPSAPTEVTAPVRDKDSKASEDDGTVRVTAAQMNSRKKTDPLSLLTNSHVVSRRKAFSSFTQTEVEAAERRLAEGNDGTTSDNEDGNKD